MPDAYERIVSGRKRAEFRFNDRNFKVLDLLRLREWEPERKEYTGRVTVRIVTDIAQGRFGIPEGYVMMSIRRPQLEDLKT